MNTRTLANIHSLRRASADCTLRGMLKGVLLSAAVSSGAMSVASAPEDPHTRSLFRQPVAGVLLDNGRTLCTVNRRSGSLSLLDLTTEQVIREVHVGGVLTDAAVHPDGRHLLVTDEQNHELILLQYDGERVHVADRHPVASFPVCVTLSTDGRMCHVSSLWSRRVSLFAVSEQSESADGLRMKPRHVLKLPFAPRGQLPLPGPLLLVTDAFAGKAAIIDAATGTIESVWDLPAHNIRGLVLTENGERILLSHQILDSRAPTSRAEVWQGLLMRNVVREIPLSLLRDPRADLDRHSRVYPLGQIGRGAADPSGLATLRNGDLLVALSGTGEVVFVKPDGRVSSRVTVGTRPLKVIVAADAATAYVLDTLSDTVTPVDLEERRSRPSISLGPRPELTSRDRGERLFYDAHQSLDGWLSCHSCHTDGHTTGRLADTQSDGTFDTPKRILSLLGTRDNNPWGWNGQFRELHQQVASSFTSTMQGAGITASETTDVVTFLHTLEPPSPVNARNWTVEELRQIADGRLLFDALGCRKCHVPPQTYTIDQVFDVGLSDERGLVKFNPPSLLGVSQRDAYFHDGSAATLESVFTEYGHQLPRTLSDEELNTLTLFLRSL